MNESINHEVFIVTSASYLGLSVQGVSVIPAVIHQQHGSILHCFIKDSNDNKLLISVPDTEVYLNIKGAMDKLSQLLTKEKPKQPLNEMDTIAG